MGGLVYVWDRKENSLISVSTAYVPLRWAQFHLENELLLEIT